MRFDSTNIYERTTQKPVNNWGKRRVYLSVCDFASLFRITNNHHISKLCSRNLVLRQNFVYECESNEKIKRISKRCKSTIIIIISWKWKKRRKKWMRQRVIFNQLNREKSIRASENKYYFVYKLVSVSIASEKKQTVWNRMLLTDFVIYSSGQCWIAQK